MITGPEALGIIAYKILGSVLGAFLALVFVIPKTRAECLRRLVVSLVVGVVFEPAVRAQLGWALELENVIASAAAAAFLSWWLMGAAVTLAQAWKGPGKS